MQADLLDLINRTREQHEFLTFMIMKDSDDWRCGVVQNGNSRFINFYDISKIDSATEKSEFMAFADRWWWESGMSLPIDCYIGKGFDKFRDTLSVLPRKSLQIEPIGPVYSITDHYLKRVKKRRVDLVNRPKPETISKGLETS
jgi:hypothetical protein